MSVIAIGRHGAIGEVRPAIPFAPMPARDARLETTVRHAPNPPGGWPQWATRCTAVLLLAAICGGAALVGCETPFQPVDDASLKAAIEAAAAREVEGAGDVGFKPLVQPPNDVPAMLAPRADELAKLGPQVHTLGTTLDLGPDLDGGSPRSVQIGLQESIVTAVRNNLGVQGSRLQQGVTQADIIRAEAAFDAVLLASTGFSRIDQSTVVFAPPGEIVPTVFGNDAKIWNFSTGIAQPLVTGGTVSVTTNWEWQNLKPEQFYFPNSSWNNNINLGVSQPLLQGFGSDVNMAQIRLARNADRKATQALRDQLLDLVSRTEAAYWRLVLARHNLAVRLWLVEVGTEVRNVLSKRREFDTTLAQYADSVAVVENRKSEVIRARRDVQQAVDALKVLMNDPLLPIGDETTIVPTDAMVDQALNASLREAIATSIQQSPLVARALLDIDDASIRQVVADNGRLPQLNLNAQMQWNGLSGTYGDSWDQIGQGQFVDYLVGLSFSQAIGNRFGEATYRRSRLERSQAVIGYRAAVQDAVFRVKEALRNVSTNYQLIGQTRAFRLAQAENLRALLVDEQTLASLTPEFLNLKFQRQDGLANAQLQESAALVDYNTAIADLYRAMGTGLAMNRIELETVDEASR